MPRRHVSLGRAELEILQYVADHGPISVRDVADHVAQTRGHARTTVLTVMERLRKKGYLTRKKIGGIYRYRPKLSKGELFHDLIHDFVDGALGGSVSPLMAYLVETKHLGEEELDRLKQLVHELETRKKGGAS